MNLKIFICAISLVCLPLNCFSQKKIRTSLQEENLKGPVKSVYTRSNKDNYLKQKFNREGFLIRKETRYLLFHNYIYDKNKKLLSYTILIKDSNRRETYTMEYDENGFITTTFMGTCENDERGNCVREKRSYGEVKRAYNDKNQVVEEWMYYGENNIIHKWIVDENGNHYEKDVLLPSDGPYTKYTYNEHGDVSLIKVVEGENEKTATVTYKYDKYNNWLERERSEPLSGYSALGDIVDHIVVRDIEYYD